MSQAPTVPSSQVPNTSVEKTANDKDLDLDAISDLYRELTAALMAEHGYIVTELDNLFQVYLE